MTGFEPAVNLRIGKQRFFGKGEEGR
jgi:hypothetical protein